MTTNIRIAHSARLLHQITNEAIETISPVSRIAQQVLREYNEQPFPNIDLFTGETEDPKIHSQGVRISENGDRYEGELVNGLAQGRGTLFYHNGDIFVGEFEKGSLYKGTIFFINGDREEGYFLNEKLHGEGKIIFADGSRNEGYFENGNLKEGIIFYPPGSTLRLFIGTIFENNFETGTLYYTNGTQKTGSFVNDKLQGNGKIISSNGTQFAGELVDDFFEGRVKTTYPDNSYIEAIYKKGILSDIDIEQITSNRFLNCLLRNSLFHPDMALILLSKFLRLKNHHSESEILESVFKNQMLLESDFNSACKQIESLLREGKPFLSLYKANFHALGIRFVPQGTEYIDCEIYNTGVDLPLFHERNRMNNKFQTRLIIRIPKQNFSQNTIRLILQDQCSRRTKELYKTIFSIRGAFLLKAPQDQVIWQSAQKRNDCTIKWIFSYLKHCLSEEAYNKIHLEFFTFILEKLTTQYNPRISSEDRKFYEEELKRKVEKRRSKYLDSKKDIPVQESL